VTGFDQGANVRQHKQHHQPYRCISRRASSRPDDFPFDERTRRGLREAAEVLSEAQELAEQQTLAELMGSCECCCCRQLCANQNVDAGAPAVLDV
jgi:hypothetical protein